MGIAGATGASLLGATEAQAAEKDGGFKGPGQGPILAQAKDGANQAGEAEEDEDLQKLFDEIDEIGKKYEGSDRDIELPSGNPLPDSPPSGTPTSTNLGGLGTRPGDINRWMRTDFPVGRWVLVKYPDCTFEYVWQGDWDELRRQAKRRSERGDYGPRDPFRGRGLPCTGGLCGNAPSSGDFLLSEPSNDTILREELIRAAGGLDAYLDQLKKERDHLKRLREDCQKTLMASTGGEAESQTRTGDANSGSGTSGVADQAGSASDASPTPPKDPELERLLSLTASRTLRAEQAVEAGQARVTELRGEVADLERALMRAQQTGAATGQIQKDLAKKNDELRAANLDLDARRGELRQLYSLEESVDRDLIREVQERQKSRQTSSALSAPPLPAGAAIAHVTVQEGDSIVFNQQAVAVTTVGEIKEVQPGDKVPVKDLAWIASWDGWKVVKPVLIGAAGVGLGTYIGSQLLSSGGSTVMAEPGKEILAGGTSGGIPQPVTETVNAIPVASGQTPLVSAYNPNGMVEQVALSMPNPQPGGAPKINSYMTPIATVENATGQSVGKIGTFNIDPKALGTASAGAGSIEIKTFDRAGNVTGSVKPLGGLMASDIKLTLDAQPKAGQPGLLNVTGLRGAIQGANLAVVPPQGEAAPKRMLMLNYTGGLTGPPSIPLTAESDTLTVPVQYPVKPGPVGVTGIIGFEGTPALQQGTSPKRNPSLGALLSGGAVGIK